MTNILEFKSKQRARIILWSGVTHAGRRLFFLDFHDAAGCVDTGVWDGDSYQEALNAARDWTIDDAALIDNHAKGADGR